MAELERILGDDLEPCFSLAAPSSLLLSSSMSSRPRRSSRPRGFVAPMRGSSRTCDPFPRPFPRVADSGYGGRLELSSAPSNS